MIKNQKISLVIPCRNEGSHLREVFKLVPTVVDEIIIVSNQSTDDTVAVARRFARSNPKIIVIEDNRVIGSIGYGFAHMSGIKAATGSIIVGADGDGTYPLKEIESVVNRLLAEKLDFISCNRYPLQNGVKIPFKLRVGVTFLNWEVRLLYGITIQDTLSGMWVFRKRIRDTLQLSMGDWNFSPQIKLNAIRHPDIRFAEYSISQHDRLGETKQNYIKTGLSHAAWIARNLCKSR